MFTHLHSHSYYSLLRGLAAPAALARAVSLEGMAALALTDFQNLSGAVEFYDACIAEGVRPILGLEVAVQASRSKATRIPFSAAGKLVILAMDRKGWASLCRICGATNESLEEAASNGIHLEKLSEETEGLICLTGGRAGFGARLLTSEMEEVAYQAFGLLSEMFPGRLYLELQEYSDRDREKVKRLIELGKRLSLPAVASHAAYYLRESDEQLHRILTAMRLNQPVARLKPEALPPPGAYLMGRAEITHKFGEVPEALAATTEIADRCRLELPLGIPHYPNLPLPEGMDALALLRQKAVRKVRSLSSAPHSHILERLDRELEVIGKTGYASLFLIMEEIVNYARSKGIPISSRGSAASSLVAHCLGITTPDPIKLDLYFERFLNPARLSPPDIDTDLCSRRREEVIRFVYERYGHERVGMVCTINRFRRRSALREVAKAHGFSNKEVNVLVESLPRRGWGPEDADSEPGEPFAELAEKFGSARHRGAFRDAAALLGNPRHLSIHPGGVVIAPGRLADLVPTQMAAKGVKITQFDLGSIQRMGLVKIDLLGIRGLSVLGDVVAAISSGSQRSKSSPLDVLDRIPPDDPATAELVQNGKTIGCFQIESPGMRATLKEIRAQDVDDIMVALALYRPGPLLGGLKEAFVRRHLHKEPVVHVHPALSSVLGETHGVILYQEQVLRIAHELAGLNLADADLLRRAMSHFDPGKQMQSLKMKFMESVMGKTGAAEEVAERIWELMAAFAGYGFPKAHAASYAQVAWQAAWCKAHHPAVFMAAVLANWGGYYPQRVYLTEARRIGLQLRPPDVNYAMREFSVKIQNGEAMLYMGLDQVRDLTRRAQARIIRYRPFHSLSDFLMRVDPNQTEAENLIKSGALASLGRIPGLLRQVRDSAWSKGQLPLFPAAHEAEVDWPLEERVAAQEAVLGISVDAHPLELASREISASGAITTIEAAAKVGEQVRVAGTSLVRRASRTVRGEHYYSIALEDLDGILDVMISAEVYRRNRSLLSGTDPFIVDGVVDVNRRSAEPYIRAEKVARITR